MYLSGHSTLVMSTAAQYTELCKRKIKSTLAHIHNTYELNKHNQKYNLKSSQGTANCKSLGTSKLKQWKTTIDLPHEYDYFSASACPTSLFKHNKSIVVSTVSACLLQDFCNLLYTILYKQCYSTQINTIIISKRSYCVYVVVLLGWELICCWQLYSQTLRKQSRKTPININIIKSEVISNLLETGISIAMTIMWWDIWWHMNRFYRI